MALKDQHGRTADHPDFGDPAESPPAPTMSVEDQQRIRRAARQEMVEEIAHHFNNAPVTPRQREVLKAGLRWAIKEMNSGSGGI